MRTRQKALTLLTLASTSAAPIAQAHATAYLPLAETVSQHEQVQLAWVARWFLKELASWAVGRVFDEGARRLSLVWSGRAAAGNLEGLANNPSLSVADRARMRGMSDQIRSIVSVLEQSSRSNYQIRQDLFALQRQMRISFDQLQRELQGLDARITNVELQQNLQLKMIVDTQGRVVRLERQVLDHEGRLHRLEGRVADQGRRIDDIERTVYPDPNRFLRHEWALSGSALYANSTVLPNDASIGAQLSAQYNMSKMFGVFANFFWAPITASDAEGFEAGSRVLWESYGVVAGLSLNVLPPQSFMSLQLSGGGGIVQSSLTEYPEGVSISDPDGGLELGSVSNAAVFGKAELGIGPPAVGIEPFAGFGYLRFVDDLAYEDSETTTNAGNELWYISLGLRWRIYDRKRHTPIAVTPRQPPLLQVAAQ